MKTSKRTIATHTRRLLKLATRLAKLRETRGRAFDMGDWGTHRGSTHVPTALHNCGTTACALGWAGLMPEFNAAGLKMKWVFNPGVRYDPMKYDLVPDPSLDQHDGQVCYKGMTGASAGAAFFGLTESEADYLFHAHGPKERMDVVRHLRDLAKDREELQETN